MIFGLAIASAPREQDVDPETGEPLNLPESREPDIQNGKILANKLCVLCHAAEGSTVEGCGKQRPHNRDTHRQADISASSHADPHLTREEMLDISGYLLSLRDSK